MDDIEKENENPEPLRAGLYIVATPIGNLRDLSFRALDTLRAADVVLCEDTRVTRKLMQAYNIKTPVKAYHDHSDGKVREDVVSRIRSGEAVALVSDAGMPLISDPGYKLVQSCEETGIYVTTIPGANAPLAALQLSGMPSDKFCFLGFLPQKTKARRDVLETWAGVPGTLVAFESASRLIASLTDIGDVLGERQVAVVREITKLYEERRKGLPQEMITHYEENGLPKGEIVLVIAPPVAEVVGEDVLQNMIRAALKSMKTKDAAKYVAEKTGAKKTVLYDMALAMAQDDAKQEE